MEFIFFFGSGECEKILVYFIGFYSERFLIIIVIYVYFRLVLSLVVINIGFGLFESLIWLIGVIVEGGLYFIIIIYSVIIEILKYYERGVMKCLCLN